MEKGKVTDKKEARTLNDEPISKSLAENTKESYKEFEKDLDAVKDVVKNPPKLSKKTVLCNRCKSKAKLVKTKGNHEVYKCPKCNYTTERWL